MKYGHGPVRKLVSNGVALCAEGEEVLRYEVPRERFGKREYPKAYWSCGHGAMVMKPLWPPVCMLMDVGLKTRQRRHIVGVKLCFECWESVRERWESVKDNIPPEWKRASKGAKTLTDGKRFLYAPGNRLKEKAG